MRNASVFARGLFGIGTGSDVRGLGIPQPRTAVEEDRRLQHRIITIVTWAMFAAFGLSLLGTVVLAVIGREVPDVLPEVLFATLGYFGGAFASFMRFAAPTA